MSLEAVLSHPTVERVGWTLVHFLWQGAVLAVIFGVELALLRKSKANLRYLAGCLMLALMVLAPCLTMFMVPVSESGLAVESDTTLPMAASVSNVVSTGPAEVSAPEGPHPEPAPSIEAARPDIAVRPAYRWKGRAEVLMEPALPYMVLGWLVGVFGLSVWHLGGWAQLQRLRRRMVRSVEPGLHNKVKELGELLGVRRAVALMESALVQVPTVVGWLKPVILLPASVLTGLTGEQLEAVLAHELAHIRRFDYLVNMLQTVVEILGFYHPAVWWVSHKIRVERENCCDDLAIGVTGDKVRYAKALTLLEEMRGSRPALAVAASGGSLLGRIRRLVGKGPREEARYSWLPAAITVLLILAIAVPTTIALNAAQDKILGVEAQGNWGEAEKRQTSNIVEGPFVVGEKMTVDMKAAELREETAWGEVVNGVKATLVSKGDYILLGDMPNMALEVRNESGQRIEITYPPKFVKSEDEKTGRWSGFGEVEIYNENGEKLDAKWDFTTPYNTHPVNKDSFLRRPCNFEYYGFSLPEPGRYKARVTFGVQPMENGKTFKVSTNWLEFKAVLTAHVPGTPYTAAEAFAEAKAFDVILLRHNKISRAEAVDRFLSVASNYPDTPFELKAYRWASVILSQRLVLPDNHPAKEQREQAKLLWKKIISKWPELISEETVSARHNLAATDKNQFEKLLDFYEWLTTRTEDKKLESLAMWQENLPTKTKAFSEKLKSLNRSLAGTLNTLERNLTMHRNIHQLQTIIERFPNTHLAELGQKELQKNKDVQVEGGWVEADDAPVGHVDDTAEGKRSLGGSGHAVIFERPPAYRYRDIRRYVEAVEIFAGRYGTATPPDEDFHLYILDAEQNVLADVRFPYAMIERAELRWYTLTTPSIEVPENRFYVALSFNPHRTKGVYLGFDESVEESHSYMGLPDKGFEKVGQSYDWMVRVHMSAEPSGDKSIKTVDRKTPKQRIAATLSNGVTVELLGICEHPSEGKQWWRPDGSLLAEKPHDKTAIKVYPDENEVGRELTLSFAGEGADKLGFTWRVPGVTASSARPVYDKGRTFRVVSFSVPENLDAVDVGVGTACGKWKTVASGPVAGGSTNDSMFDRGVIFYGAYERDGLTIVSVAHQISEVDSRVVAVDKSGNEYEARRESGGAGEGITGNTYSFDLSSSEIRAFDLQARPYEWVEFKNVSLKPGVKTDVEVGVIPPVAEISSKSAPRAVEAGVSEVSKVIRLKYADPEDLSERLNAIFSEPDGVTGMRLDETGKVIAMVRFIPDPREKTILVLCPPELVGSVEQMIKELDRPWPSIQVRQFSATLSNGATVELLGICEHPSEGKQWWRPDGDMLQERPYERLHEREAYGHLRLFEVVYRVKPGKGLQSKIDKTEAIRGSFGPYPIERETEGVSELAKDSFYAYIPVKNGLDKIDLPVLCGTERGWQWHARIESPVDHSDMNTDKVDLSARAGNDNRTIAFVTRRVFDEELRVIAKDKSGEIHKPVSDKRKAMNWAGSITAEFDLPLAEVASIEVQTQKFDKVVFKNVSLKPGAKTDVEVVVASAAARERLEKVNLKDVEVKNILAKLGEWTGKSIIAESDVLSQKITVYSADELTRSDALSVIYAALRQRGIVAEKKGDIIILTRVEDEDLGSVAVPGEADEQVVDEKTRKERLSQERAKIAERLAALENHRDRVQRDLDLADRSLEEVRARWGISDLEERSYPHPITSRLSRLQEERDDCVVEASRLEASIEILDKKVQAADAEQKAHGFKVNLEKARDELILLRTKLERLKQMVEEAEAKKKDLDSARAQYKQRLAVRDERRQMLDSIKEQIEKLRIVHDDPQITAAPVAGVEEPDKEESARQEGRLNREEIRAKLVNLGNREMAIHRNLNAAEMAMAEVRQRWGFSDLEEHSYPHPVTARLMRLEQERDTCLVQIAQLRAEASNLEGQAETADGKANLKRVQDDLVVLQEKYEQLQRMCDEAAAKKKDLDTARVQYKQRASIRDERKRMLDSVKEQIEKLRILHDDPQTPQVRE